MANKVRRKKTRVEIKLTLSMILSISLFVVAWVYFDCYYYYTLAPRKVTEPRLNIQYNPPL
jgi:hypothetical protein